MPPHQPPVVEVPLEKLQRLRELQEAYAARDRVAAARFIADPVGWASFRLDASMWSKQREIARSVVEHRRTAVRSAHGTGKSWLASTLATWWVDAHPPGETLVVTTAPSYEQVHSILWEEIRRHHATGKLPGKVQLSDRWLLDNGEQVGLGRRPADYNQHSFQGLHRRYVLVLIDEACGLPAWLWTAVEAITTGPDCRILAIGNPDDSSSTFAKVAKDPGWNSIRISAFNSPNLTGEEVPQALSDSLVSAEWVADVGRQWGEGSPLYRSKVLGEFADGEDGLIPLSWVVAAHQRWYDWKDDRRAASRVPKGRTVFGVDVGHKGEDRTCIATRKGDVVMQVEFWSQIDTVATTGLVEARLDANVQSVALVDGIGVGAGVVDLLRAHGKNVRSFVAGAATKRRDVTGALRFPNVRSAAWWNLRELLDPASDPTLALPPDDDLTADLTTPRWTEASGAKIVVESKDEIRKRLGRSTDAGDAVVQCLWTDALARRPGEPGSPESLLRPVTYAENGGGWSVGRGQKRGWFRFGKDDESY